MLITAIIPMRNEETAIERCLDSVLRSRLPDGAELEILVFDGESTDRSVELVRGLATADPRIQLHANPARLQAAAFNRGIELARGDFIVRLDAHSEYAPDYVAECVRLLEETGAENVGGVQRATGEGWLGRAIAAAVSSRFAAGDARYRFASEPCFTDTVYLGSWRTATLRELGGMRTDLAVNEDYEMNVRLRARGGRIYLSPSVRSTYYVRDSLTRLARQYFRYGFWKVRTLMEHPASLRWRQLVAPVWVVSLLLTPLLMHWLGWWGLAHLGLYLVADLCASAFAARNAGSSALMLPLIFPLIHCAWGLGFLSGLVWWPLRRP